MSSQLLGANASLNANGGVPGAAPTLLQGALVVPQLGVNGPLNVTSVNQPAATFSNGGVGAALNSVEILLPETPGSNATTLKMNDNGTIGSLQYEGSAVGGTAFPFGRFLTSKPLAVVSPNGTTPGSPTTGFIVTNGLLGAAENAIYMQTDEDRTRLCLRDVNQNAIIEWSANLGYMRIDKYMVLDMHSTRANYTAAIVSGTVIPAPGMTPSSVVIVTQRTGVPAASALVATPGTDGFTVTFLGGGTITVSWYWATIL